MKQFKPPYKVVVVDDDEDVCNIISSFVAHSGVSEFDCTEFHSAEQALEYVKSNDVHLILSDINMPGMHGETFMREVRSLNRGVYLVVMTGEASITKVLSSKTNYDHGFLIKPLNFDQLTSILKSFVANMESWELTVRKIVS